MARGRVHDFHGRTGSLIPGSEVDGTVFWRLEKPPLRSGAIVAIRLACGFQVALRARHNGRCWEVCFTFLLFSCPCLRLPTRRISFSSLHWFDGRGGNDIPLLGSGIMERRSHDLISAPVCLGG